MACDGVTRRRCELGHQPLCEISAPADRCRLPHGSRGCSPGTKRTGTARPRTVPVQAPVDIPPPVGDLGPADPRPSSGPAPRPGWWRIRATRGSPLLPGLVGEGLTESALWGHSAELADSSPPGERTHQASASTLSIPACGRMQPREPSGHLRWLSSGQPRLGVGRRVLDQGGDLVDARAVPRLDDDFDTVALAHRRASGCI
jgi:hypothetical protein